MRIQAVQEGARIDADGWLEFVPVKQDGVADSGVQQATVRYGCRVSNDQYLAEPPKTVPLLVERREGVPGFRMERLPMVESQMPTALAWRPDGSVVPRNDFVGKPLHRADLRFLRHFALGRHAKVDGIVELFNVFNHKNYGSYVTTEQSAAYGQPVQNVAVEYQPRMMQLGFRLQF